MIDIKQTIYSFNRDEEEKQFELVAKKNSLPYVDLMGYPILLDVLKIIPQETAEKEKVVAYLRAGNDVKIATSNPTNQNLQSILLKIEKAIDARFTLAVCSNSSLNYALSLYNQVPESTSSEKIEVTGISKEKFAQDIKNLVELKDKIKNVPTTELLDVLFTGAIISEASDIHLEPQESNLQVRYRVDGVLQNIATLPLQSYQVLNSRIKYLAGLKLDLRNVPQDGRFDFKASGRAIDVRISTLPAAFGEIIEMRLLPKDKTFITLDQLGFSPEYIKMIREAAKKPQGIVFNTGPTGSGKTTTLYAILAELNKPGVKLITLEDPIEYRLKGVDQSQVEPDKGYTFATGLRSILRQDPDIIMVGEIRDDETATTAIQAAMTGHLVLTTLHTNNAPTAIPRLLDMGVKPYLLGGSINLIIAQRLVRKICVNCHGKGCDICGKTGYKGRIVIAELLVPTKEIEELIQRKATLREFTEAAKKAGMKSMLEDGMDKVKQGITTEEEVLRVTQE